MTQARIMQKLCASPSPTPFVSRCVTDEGMPPVFFNLQGMKVARPAKGQIYIMVRGNKSSKVMF